MLILGLTVTASAQTWTDEASGVLVAQPGTITANGVGSPSVVWDPDDERYVMFFETRTGPATPGDCAAGTWSIGIASSDDGLSWDVWPDAVVAPTAGTPWRCVAAHPTAVYDDGTWHLWFKAEQGTVPAACGNAWGCNNYSGIAHATVDVDLDDKTADIDAVEAEIVLVEDEQPVLDPLATSLADYEADLRANAGEFLCAEPLVPGLCAPCGTFLLAAPEGTSDTQPVCQPFRFQIPNQVGVTNNTPGHVVTLSFTTLLGANVVCEYRANGGGYVLDDSDVGPRMARCLAPNQTAVAGTSVATAIGVTLAIDAGPATPIAGAVLTATNLGVQTFTGSLITGMDAAEAAVASDDGEAVLALLPDLSSDLGDLMTWFDEFVPSDPEKTQLQTDGLALIAEIDGFEADLDVWATELNELRDERDELVAYTQSVDVVTLLSQVGVQINRIFGYPAVMKQGSAWVMMFQDYPNVWRATSNSPDGPFVVDASPVMSAGTVSWATTEVYDPNLMCSDDAQFPYETYFGGRTVTAGTFTSGGISDGYSSDAVTWVLNTASQLFGWTNVDQYRHFDVIRASDGEHRMWYTSRVGGVPQVNVASTTASFDDALATQRVCP